MKTLKLLGMALFTVLLSASFSSCGSDGDDSSGGSIEGTWTVKLQTWYGWDFDKNEPDWSDINWISTDEDYEVWILTKSGDNYNLRQMYGEGGKQKTETSELVHVSGNEYKQNKNGKMYDRVVFKSVSGNAMVVEYTENYYRTDTKNKEFGVINFYK